MRESYPPSADANSPAPPARPEPPPEKFQFSLKQLLAFMLASAVLATGVRYVVQLFGQIPDSRIAGYLYLLVLSLVFGAFLYFLIRGPFLLVHAARFSRRWRTIRGHRRDLEQWSRERIKQREPAVEPPVE
ncbi:MAG TPA: hypothetical protein VFB80_05180 [Pirellulaceae bacterium]|nr:hypothetical protein [Pirellulaceae bacterium]